MIALFFKVILIILILKGLALGFGLLGFLFYIIFCSGKRNDPPGAYPTLDAIDELLRQRFSKE